MDVSPRYITLATRLQEMLGAPHLGVLGGLFEQLGSRPADHVVLGDQRLAVVVLSRATEERDRGRKRLASMRVEGLQEYLLVAQDRVLVERHSRHGDEWMYRSYEAGEVTLSTGHVLSLDALYEGMGDIEGEP